MCSLDSDLASLIDGVESDYALTLAQKGIALNLGQIFEEGPSECVQILRNYKEAEQKKDKLEALEELETLYNKWVCN